jgi:hypothetical protein
LQSVAFCLPGSPFGNGDNNRSSYERLAPSFLQTWPRGVFKSMIT